MNFIAIAEGFTLLWLVVHALGALATLLTGGARHQSLGLQASVFYHNAFTLAFKGDLDLDADVIRMMILADAHSEDVSDDFVDDVSGDEVSDASYGRVTLSNSAVTDDDANDRSEWDFDDVVFSSLDGVTAGKLASYQQIGGDDSTEANDPLICLWDIANTAANGTDFTAQPGSEGAVQWS